MQCTLAVVDSDGRALTLGPIARGLEVPCKDGVLVDNRERPRASSWVVALDAPKSIEKHSRR